MYRLICQRPANFSSAQMALVSTFFQMFIVLGMYNFGTTVNIIIQGLRFFKIAQLFWCASVSMKGGKSERIERLNDPQIPHLEHQTCVWHRSGRPRNRRTTFWCPLLGHKSERG